MSGTARDRSLQPLVPRYRKVFVMAPANLVTGGPEALHQLVDAVRRCGGEAYISYYPRGVRAEIPQDYRCYDVVQADVEDAPGNLVVFPETQPLMGRTFVRAATAMWWLSVDHFLQHPERPDWEEVRRHVNFAQSHYAADLLARYGVESIPLTDYLNDDFRAPWWAWRRNAIAYNVKSAPEIERLKSISPELAGLTWIELADMSRAEVRKALCKVKVYADFGSHPGRDRMPREAALCGACVLTNRRGSANFAEDVPLPTLYKLDQDDPAFAQNVGRTIRLILATRPFHVWRQQRFRRFAASAKASFTAEVRRAFFA